MVKLVEVLFLIVSIFKVIAERKAGRRAGRGLRPYELVLEETEQTGWGEYMVASWC